MPRTIFVTGAGGFIGKRLVEKFSRETAENVIGYTSHECNLLSPDAIVAAFSAVTKEDVLIMGAAITRLRENSYDAMIKNIRMAENLSRFLKKHPVGLVIFFSTVDVYGILTDDVVITENILPNPNDYYAISKLASEYLLRQTLSRGGIPLTIFRLSGVYGPGDKGKSTIDALVTSAQTKRKITVFGDGTNKRDFVFADDLFRLTAEAIRKKENMTVNVATGRSYSIAEIANMIAEALGNGCSVEYMPTDNTNEKRITHMIYHTRKLCDCFPDMEFTNINSGLKLMPRYFQVP